MRGQGREKEQKVLLIEQKGNTYLSQYHFQKAPKQLVKSSETQVLSLLLLPSFPPIIWKNFTPTRCPNGLLKQNSGS